MKAAGSFLAPAGKCIRRSAVVSQPGSRTIKIHKTVCRRLDRSSFKNETKRKVGRIDQRIEANDTQVAGVGFLSIIYKGESEREDTSCLQ